MPKKSQSKAPAKKKTATKAKKTAPPAPVEEVLAQSAEVTHESGVLDDAAVVEALEQTQGGAAAGAARGNARCRVLDLRSCPLDDDGDGAFRAALATNNSIVAVRTALDLDDVAATRAAAGLSPLIVTDEDSGDDDDDDEEEGVYCDGSRCGKLLAGDAEVFTDADGRDFCGVRCAPNGSTRGLRRALARDRFADAVLADLSN